MDHVEKESVRDLLETKYMYEHIISVRHECFWTVNLKAVELGSAF